MTQMKGNQVFTVVAPPGTNDLGFKLEIWPPAPKVLVQSVSKACWAREVGIKAGDQLLTLQKQSLETIDRELFRKQLRSQRPLELSFRPARKKDVERIASTRIQGTWRSRKEEAEELDERSSLKDSQKDARNLEDLGGADLQKSSPRLPTQKISGIERMDESQLRDELIAKEEDLKRLRLEISRSESIFQKSLANISADSSSSALEVVSLKAQLAIEKSKARLCPDVTNRCLLKVSRVSFCQLLVGVLPSIFVRRCWCFVNSMLAFFDFGL